MVAAPGQRTQFRPLMLLDGRCDCLARLSIFVTDDRTPGHGLGPHCDDEAAPAGDLATRNGSLSLPAA